MNQEELRYISLQEATKYCGYSQEYLSLRARQGKLKSVKFGRNWVTTKKWLEKYLKEIEKYNNNFKDKKAFSLIENLPTISEPSLEISELNIFPSLTLIVILIFILIFCGILFAPSYFLKTGGDSQLAAVVAQEILKYTFDTFKEYGQWVSENIKNQISNFKTAYFALINLIKKKPLPEPEREGMVVVPSTEEDESIQEKIKKSFSDEVKVEMKDKTWGIIKPIFRTPTAEEYLYIMVPVKN